MNDMYKKSVSTKYKLVLLQIFEIYLIYIYKAAYQKCHKMSVTGCAAVRIRKKTTKPLPDIIRHSKPVNGCEELYGIVRPHKCPMA
jgi:hypothetical protein